MKKYLLNRKIVDFRDMTEKEIKAMGWTKFAFNLYKVIVLDDGQKIVAMRDEEGNDIGAFAIVP